MSMAVILEQTRDFLQSDNTWRDQECRLAFNGQPSDAAMGDFFVGIDENSQPTTPSGNFLRQEHWVNVYCWRKVGVRPEDKKANLMLQADPYAPTLETISTLAKKVLASLHKNETLRATINTALGVPNLTVGDKLLSPAILLAEESVRTAVTDDGNGKQVWAGRQLIYGGYLQVTANDVVQAS